MKYLVWFILAMGLVLIGRDAYLLISGTYPIQAGGIPLVAGLATIANAGIGAFVLNYKSTE